MPTKPLRPCNKPGCRELTSDGYCDTHRRDSNRYYDQHIRDKKATEFYHSLEWQRARKAVLIRDHGLCQHCLKDNRVTTADMVHHIKPLKTHWILRVVLSNLISLCNACHNKVHGKGE